MAQRETGHPLNKCDTYLNEWILHTSSVLDGRFRVDGIQEWREYHQSCGCVFEIFIAKYILARWYIFASMN